MAENTEHSHSNYLKIYKWLVALFLISVAGPWLAPGVKIIVLTTAFGIAVVKALLVAANFMHLNIERKYIWHLFLLCLVFLFALFAGVAPDVMNKRGTNWVNTSGPVALSSGHKTHSESTPAEPSQPEAVTPVEPVAPVEQTEPVDPAVSTTPVEPTQTETSDPELVAQGKELFQSKICATCHQTDPAVPTPAGAVLKAPAFLGSFWGVEREVLIDADPNEIGFQDSGKTEKVKLDEAYFKESVEKPFAKIVKGAVPGMAPLPTTEEERAALAAYVKSLSK